MIAPCLQHLLNPSTVLEIIHEVIMVGFEGSGISAIKNRL